MEFSVTMSVYKNDRAEHFREALNSIINQTVIPKEIVLVVDGYVPENIVDTISDFSDKNILLKVIWLEKNVGHGNALQAGLDNCNCDLVAMMDSDDICVEDRFEKQLKCFEEDKELKIVGGYIYEFIDDVSNVISIRDVPLSDADIKNYIKSRCPFNQVSIMFKKSAVLKVGGYLDWYYDEDYYLWIRMYQADYKFLNLSDNLVYVRIGENMYRRRGGLKYFKSEAKLQKYMYDANIINFYKYLFNIIIRLFMQVLIPDSLRRFFFQKLFRKRGIVG